MNDDLHRFGPLVVIAICFALGKTMKDSPRVPNWLIAPMLTVLGLTSGVATAVATGGDWRSSLSSAVLGLLSGAGAVGLHQSATSLGTAKRIASSPPSAPKPPPLPLLLVLALLLVGCAPSQEYRDLTKTAATATGRLDPLLLGMMVEQDNECLAGPVPERARCIEHVRTRWAPVRAELAKVRAAWCKLEPERCEAVSP